MLPEQLGFIEVKIQRIAFPFAGEVNANGLILLLDVTNHCGIDLVRADLYPGHGSSVVEIDRLIEAGEYTRFDPELTQSFRTSRVRLQPFSEFLLGE